ncbi:hypothetical protein D3C75_683230 [compost metagenome]
MNQKLSKTLLSMGVEPELIYELLNKDCADRYVEIQIQRFENGDSSAMAGTMQLTDEEAFYVATGIPDTASYQNNTRDKNNIGSIFVMEVDSSDDKAVRLHFYEHVRNSEEDQHTATSAWLSVDRRTGRVTNTLFED